jgi:hypothetical protein
LLDLPGLLGDVPQIGDLLASVRPAAQQLKDTLADSAGVLSPLSDLLG